MIVMAFMSVIDVYSQSIWEDFGLKTNLLYDAVTAVNLGVSVPIVSGLSLDMTLAFPDWVDRDNNRYAMQIELAECSLNKTFNLRQHNAHCGIYAQFGKGCIQLNSQYGHRINGFQAAGIELGYLQRINEQWAIDYEIGIGWTRIRYDYYRIEKYGNRQYLASQQNWRNMLTIWPFPTKAGVSLIYYIGGLWK